jgi:hypothetical protein
VPLGKVDQASKPGESTKETSNAPLAASEVAR